MDKSYEPMRLGGTGRNVERLGVFVAWLISNSLMNAALERSAGGACASVRMQALTGPEFLSTVLHGELKPEHLSEIGRAFADHYFVSGRFLDDYNSCKYDGEDEWLRYDEVSPLIGAAYRRYSEPDKPRLSARIIKFPFGARKG